MSQFDERSPSSSETSAGSPQAVDPGSAGELSPGPIKESSSPGLAWLLVVAAGLLAGLAGFGIGEAAPRFVAPSLEFSAEIRRNGTQVPIEMERRFRISRDQTAALAYGGLGMILGLGLGLAGGLARRSPSAAIAGGIVGLVLGGAAGAGTTLAVLPSYHAARDSATDENHNDDLPLALLTHGGIWIAVGAAAGLALGIGLGGGARMARATIGGILGAAIASMLYEFGGAIMFPLAETFRPMAKEAVPRLFAQLVVGLCVAAGALLVADHLALRRTTSQPDR